MKKTKQIAPENGLITESLGKQDNPKASYLILLISILFLFLVRPFMIGFLGIQALINGLFTVILIAGTYSFSRRKGVFICALLLVVPWIGTRVYLYFEPRPTVEIIDMALLAAFFAFGSVIILSHLLQARSVNTDMIFGSICAYFLIGLMWGTIFALIQHSAPGTFQITKSTDSDRFDLIYYSFVALTTLGFGDISRSAPRHAR